MMYNDERYEMTTMNRQRTVPHAPGLLAALRAGFLLLVALLFLLNLQSASSQQSEAGPAVTGSFGLLPHHIDLGIDRVPLDSLTRHRVDSLRIGYRIAREDAQREIATLREQMLQQLNVENRAGLDTTRRRVRDLMFAQREFSDRYGRDVAALLHSDQVALLLDMTFVWGEELEQTDEPIAGPVVAEEPGSGIAASDESDPVASPSDQPGAGVTAEGGADAATETVILPVTTVRSTSGVATVVRSGTAGERAQPASP